MLFKVAGVTEESTVQFNKPIARTQYSTLTAHFQNTQIQNRVSAVVVLTAKPNKHTAACVQPHTSGAAAAFGFNYYFVFTYVYVCVRVTEQLLIPIGTDECWHRY